MSTSVDNTTAELCKQYQLLFFSDTAFPRILTYLTNACTTDVSDPVIYTLVQALNNPLSITLTDIGLAVFRDAPTLIYPYQYMNLEQRTFLVKMVNHMQENDLAVLVKQMGGGFSITLHNQKRFLPALEHSFVLTTFCRLVLQSGVYQSLNTREAICNIVLQQIGACVGITRETMHVIYNNVHELYSNAEPE